MLSYFNFSQPSPKRPQVTNLESPRIDPIPASLQKASRTTEFPVVSNSSLDDSRYLSSIHPHSSSRKGLSNEIGENNCFLNVIIQSLWHVRSCRVLITTGDHALHHRCVHKYQDTHDVSISSDICLLCEFEQLFILYQFSEEPVLEVNRIRLALSNVFPLGAMNDATETFEAILETLHYETFARMMNLKQQQIKEDAYTMICEPQCVAHFLFQMNLMEIKKCRTCKETNEPMMQSDFLYRVYAQELLMHSHTSNFSQLLQKEALGGCIADEYKVKCEHCKKPMDIEKWILSLPMVFTVAVVWSADHVDKTQLKQWMGLLSSQEKNINLSDIFQNADYKKEELEYTFRGMVCYYGRHYVGFFVSRSLEHGDGKTPVNRWFLFDDTRVKRVGTWEDVRQRIERGGYQPTLLFYEKRGIQTTQLESIAKRIHTWWQEEGEAKHNNDETKVESKSSGAPESFKAPLPISPISTSQNDTKKSQMYGEDDLFKIHKSAEDTLSRANRILSKDSSKLSSAPPSFTSEKLRASLAISRRLSKVPRKSLSNFSNLNLESIPDNTPFNVDINQHAKSPRASLPLPNRERVDSIDRENIFKDVDDEKVEATNESSKFKPESMTQHDSPKSSNNQPIPYIVELHPTDGGLGLIIEEKDMKKLVPRSAGASQSNIPHQTYIVGGFERNASGQKLVAEDSEQIQKGDILVAIDDSIITVDSEYTLEDVLAKLWMSASPVLSFVRPPSTWSCPKCTLVNDEKLIFRQSTSQPYSLLAVCSACSENIHWNL